MPDLTDKVYTIDMIMTKILRDDRSYDISKIVAAYDFAAQCHEGQTRSSGQPYIIHPVAVAYILLELGMDTDTICAALLHDVVEDTSATREDVQKRFGNDVAMLVDGVTKLAKVPTNTKEEQQAKNVMSILLAMSQDIRVMIIKLADRLHNMRTLQFRPPVKRQLTSFETLNIYAPIAHRMGITAIQEELEELSLYWLDPFAYSDIVKLLDAGRAEREAFIEQIKTRIAERFKTEDFLTPPQIDGRAKSIYGIFKKMFYQGKAFDEIYDKYAVRVIVNTVNECYNVLGLVHDLFSPIPGRFKDYIATPKSNGYQSLHTSVLAGDGPLRGTPFEIQIRTWEMHASAEYGLAAHWKYKERISGRTALDTRLAWLRQVLETTQSSDDPEELVATLKNDIAPEDVVVMTPKGDSVSLPVGATIIDFAYHIHTDVGHRTVSAKANGRIVPLNYQLATGDLVEIITSKDPARGPSRGWLEIVHTNEARAKIRAWFRKERRPENIASGRAQLEHECRRLRLPVTQEQLAVMVQEDLHLTNCNNLEDLYAAIGYGGFTLTKLMPRIREIYQKRFAPAEPPKLELLQETPTDAKNGVNVIVDGLTGIEVKLARCCSPLQGDPIIGFMTVGHGISIHKQACRKYQEALADGDAEEMARWVKVSWASAGAPATQRANFVVVGLNNGSLYGDLNTVVNESHLHVLFANFRLRRDGNAVYEAAVTVSSPDQVEKLLERLRSVRDVISAERS